jgi:hypothetical protein
MDADTPISTLEKRSLERGYGAGNKVKEESAGHAFPPSGLLLYVQD